MVRRIFYDCLLHPVSWLAAWLLFAVFYRLRYRGWKSVPRQGGLLIVANHQSHFDPVLVGVACRRPLTYLARDTLFRGAFGWLIRLYQAIPVRRDGLGLDGIKEVLRRLRRGEAVVIFPEGTRTPDGTVRDFRPGIAALAKRAKVPILPVALEGAYQIWPRDRVRPKFFGMIQLEVGEPLEPEATAAFDERQLLQKLHDRVEELFECAQATRDQRLGKAHRETAEESVEPQQEEV